MKVMLCIHIIVRLWLRLLCYKITLPAEDSRQQQATVAPTTTTATAISSVWQQRNYMHIIWRKLAFGLTGQMVLWSAGFNPTKVNIPISNCLPAMDTDCHCGHWLRLSLCVREFACVRVRTCTRNCCRLLPASPAAWLTSNYACCCYQRNFGPIIIAQKCVRHSTHTHTNTRI